MYYYIRILYTCRGQLWLPLLHIAYTTLQLINIPRPIVLKHQITSMHTLDILWLSILNMPNAANKYAIIRAWSAVIIRDHASAQTRSASSATCTDKGPWSPSADGFGRPYMANIMAATMKDMQVLCTTVYLGTCKAPSCLCRVHKPELAMYNVSS